MTESDNTADQSPARSTENYLTDSWSGDRLIPLTGRLEKSGFPPWLTLIAGLILAFVLFQGISLVVTFALLVMKDVSLTDLTTQLDVVLEQNARELMIANTVGQVFGLLIPAIIFARLHSKNHSDFLRLRSTDIRLIVLSVIGLLALVPIVHWTGVVSDSLPWPQSIRDFEQAQMDLIDRILLQDFSVTFALSVMALTPAISEELLFRGYIQRQAERSMGIWGGILFSGLIFGLYHVRPTQAVPLSLLGLYLAYITWRSGSIIPAMIVHFANNAFAIALGRYAQTEAGSALDVESFQVPFSVVVPAALILAIVTFGLDKTAKLVLRETSINQGKPDVSGEGRQTC
ncbi:MAG: CPBP family intramembrane metalloprotease [Rhodothermia bacterium]|nr:MAG: CPBP family intramembrane metalloprotease [Rhodothermia bacterium]